jgi:G:T-mismatch repair DNA endonuclease (very short patch repair protein)
MVAYKEKFCQQYIIQKKALLGEFKRYGKKMSIMIEYKPSIYYYTKQFNKYNSNVQERIYVLANNIKDRPKCKKCGKPVNFHKHYARYCSNSCAQSSIEIINKKKKTSFRHYGVVFPLRNKEVMSRLQNTNLKRYGFKTPLSNKNVRQKIKETNLKLHGYENPFKNTENLKKIWMEKYEVDNPRKSEVVKEKIRNTLYKRYGVINGYQIASDNTYSKISQELFWSVYNQLPKRLKNKTYFAELNHEYHNYDNLNKRAYSFDFVILNLNLCIEFHGDMWHGNPTIYASGDKPIPFKNDVLSKDIWKLDKQKENFIKKLGFKYIIVWEQDYCRNKELIVKNLLSKIERLRDEQYAKI